MASPSGSPSANNLKESPQDILEEQTLGSKQRYAYLERDLLRRINERFDVVAMFS